MPKIDVSTLTKQEMIVLFQEVFLQIPADEVREIVFDLMDECERSDMLNRLEDWDCGNDEID